jgi:hypothetical protein
VEGRGSAEGNTASESSPVRSAGQGVSSDLDRVRQLARKDKDGRFTALLHHVTVDRLREAYRAISPNAAAGVDGITWRDYGLDLEANLLDLHARVHRGAYRAMPTRRVFIPKAAGRLRPLGVAGVGRRRGASAPAPQLPEAEAGSQSQGPDALLVQGERSSHRRDGRDRSLSFRPRARLLLALRSRAPARATRR